MPESREELVAKLIQDEIDDAPRYWAGFRDNPPLLPTLALLLPNGERHMIGMNGPKDQVVGYARRYARAHNAVGLAVTFEGVRFRADAPSGPRESILMVYGTGIGHVGARMAVWPVRTGPLGRELGRMLEGLSQPNSVGLWDSVLPGSDG